MTEKVRALAEEFRMLPSGAVVLCAVSGGADSMCLLHLLSSLSRELGFSVHCAHYNHSLRPVDADRDEEFVRRWCEEHGIPFACGRGDVAAVSEKTGRGVEETAREMRYAFLEETARQIGASRIATAHTADDNAETLLLNLARGAGLQGMCAITPRRGMIVRPLLQVTRLQVEEYCAQHELPFVTDITNADEEYTRNFVRRQIVPLLRQVNPRAVEHMSSAIGKVRADHQYLNSLAGEMISHTKEVPYGLTINADELAALPEVLASRVVRLMMERVKGTTNCAEVHVAAVLKLCREENPSAKVDLPGMTARRVYGELILEERQEQVDVPQEILLNIDGETVYGSTGWIVECHETVCPPEEERIPGGIWLDKNKLRGPLLLRPRHTGDVLKIEGRPEKSLKKWMIEDKIPQIERDQVPVLVDNAGVLAVAGLGGDASRLAVPGERALEIIFWKE